jgi:hypothetical protein
MPTPHPGRWQGLKGVQLPAAVCSTTAIFSTFCNWRQHHPGGHARAGFTGTHPRWFRSVAGDAETYGPHFRCSESPADASVTR